MRKIKIIVALTVAITILISVLTGNMLFITTSSPTLCLGSYGSDVLELQQRLKNWGYFKGELNGRYGIQTLMAVSAYQKKLGITPNGVAGSETLTAMGMTRITEAGTAYAAGKGTSDEQLLARAINGEARGEPYEGQVAVGAVILNRTKDPKFPKTIAGVIYQPGAFTAVSDGQINVPIDSKSTVLKAARDALNGWDPTNGCIYYWNPATATSKWIWSRQIVKKIGKHNFGK